MYKKLKAQNDIISYIKQNISIETVANNLGLNLSKQSNNLVGNCPTGHSSNSKTCFHVNIHNNLCHCFNCGKGGSVIDLIMLANSCSISESIKWINDKYNLGFSNIPTVKLSDDEIKEQQEAQTKAILYEAVFDFGKTKLFENEGQLVLDYLINERGYAIDEVNKMDVIYFPKISEITNHLKSLYPKYSPYINDLKLNGHFGDKFRLAFPYRDRNGHITGFVKRSTNSTGETITTHDGKTHTKVRFDSTTGLKKDDLFGLHRISKEDTILIVEGYMDAMYLYEIELKNIVAVGQGKLSKTHVDGLLSKKIKNVIISFDNDSVGPDNTYSAIELLLKETDINIFVLNPGNLGNHKDPDEYVKANGIEKFQALVDSSTSGASWAVNYLVDINKIDTEIHKTQTFEKIKEFTKLVKNTIYRDQIIDMVCDQFNYKKGEVKKLIGDYVEQTKNKLEVTGDFWSCNEKGISFNIIEYVNFLQEAGYSKYYMDKDYIFVKTENNIVNECTLFQIKDFVISYIKKIDEDEMDSNDQLLSFMFDKQGKYFDQGLIECVSSLKIDFKRDSKDSANLYFRNGYVSISKDGSPIFNNYETLKSCIWSSSINKREIELMKVKTFRSEYEQFLWNVSDRNTDKFLSLCSVIGYLIHDYKEESNAKAIVFYDSKIPVNGEPNGRTGKSLIGKAIEKVKEVVRVDGKNYDFKPTFTFQMVKPSSRIIDFNDVKSNFDFEKLFSVITDGMTIEYKNKTPFEIPFSESPKIMISTNYTIKGIGSSYKDRMFEIEISDFYNPTHKPKDDFGHDFFTDWDNTEWNAFFNFIIECVQLYLDEGLIGCASENIEVKKLLDSTSEQFVEFADNFIKVNEESDIKLLYLEFKKFIGFEMDMFNKCPVMQHTFTSWLTIYANFKGLKISKRKSNGKQFVTFSE